MKKIISILLFLVVQFAAAQSENVQQRIEFFFEAFHQLDTIQLKKVCSSELILHSITESEKGSSLTTQSATEFYKTIAAFPKDLVFEEKILNYVIQLDGSMAHVWTPYEFYINGKLSHSGVNSFQLFNENGVWKVLYILDTRRRKS